MRQLIVVAVVLCAAVTAGCQRDERDQTVNQTVIIGGTPTGPTSPTPVAPTCSIMTWMEVYDTGEGDPRGGCQGADCARKTSYLGYLPGGDMPSWGRPAGTLTANRPYMFVPVVNHGGHDDRRVTLEATPGFTGAESCQARTFNESGSPKEVYLNCAARPRAGRSGWTQFVEERVGGEKVCEKRITPFAEVR